MARIISVANQKGGVAKTTTTVNLGTTLSFVLKKKVLLIDMDAQGNMTDNLGFDISDDDDDVLTTFEVLKNEATMKEAIQHYHDIDFVPADIALTNAETTFTHLGREYLLKKALEPIKDDYDFIIIDTPPSLGILTVNSFTASDEIIIPVESSFFSIKGLKFLNETIRGIQEYTNPNLIIRGVLFTKFDERFNISKEMKAIADEITSVIGVPIFKTSIRRTVLVDEAQVAGVDLLSFYKRTTAEEDYISFAKEYLGMVEDIND